MISKFPSNGILEMVWNLPSFFRFKKFQQIWSLEAFKISAKILNASSDSICWNFLKRKKLGRFQTISSKPLEGNFDIMKKTAFWILRTTLPSRASGSWINLRVPTFFVEFLSLQSQCGMENVRRLHTYIGWKKNLAVWSICFLKWLFLDKMNTWLQTVWD